MQYNRNSIYNINYSTEKNKSNQFTKNMWQYLNAIHAIKVVAISTSACTLSSSCNREKQLKLYNLQKDVISTQKQPSCKKKCAALCKMPSMKKVFARMRQHKFIWIVVIKIFVTDLPSQPFLGCHPVFYNFFFILAILHRAAPFPTAWVLDTILFERKLIK